jgi:hypothetical protein
MILKYTIDDSGGTFGTSFDIRFKDERQCCLGAWGVQLETKGWFALVHDSQPVTYMTNLNYWFS